MAGLVVKQEARDVRGGGVIGGEDCRHLEEGVVVDRGEVCHCWIRPALCLNLSDGCVMESLVVSSGERRTGGAPPVACWQRVERRRKEIGRAHV